MVAAAAPLRAAHLTRLRGVRNWTMLETDQKDDDPVSPWKVGKGDRATGFGSYA